MSKNFFFAKMMKMMKAILAMAVLTISFQIYAKKQQLY